MQSYPPFSMPQNPAPDGVFLLPVCTTKENLAFILAAITAYGRVWPKEARNSQYDILEALAYIDNPADAICSEGLGMKLRQNPDDSCQFQQEQGKDNWVTVFDYSLCRPLSPSDVIITAELMAELQIIINNYNGTIGSIAPDLVYDSTAEDANRDHVMCAAIALAIRTLVDALIRQSRTQSTLIELIGVTVGLLGGVMLVAFTGGTGVAGAAPLSVGIAGAIIGLAGLAGQLSLDILEDSEFIEDFICCMVGGVIGDNPTQTRLADAAGACMTTFTNPLEQLFIEFVVAAIEELDFYLSFLDFAQRLYDAPGIANFICECEPTWEHVFDFTLDDGGWEQLDDTTGELTWNASPSWVNGVGWTHGDNTAVGDITLRRRSVAIQIGLPESRIVTSAELVYSLTKGTINNTAASCQRLRTGVFPNQIEFAGRSFSATPAGSDLTFSDLNINQLCHSFTVITHSSRTTSASWSGAVTFSKITLRGIGTNPFTL